MTDNPLNDAIDYFSSEKDPPNIIGIRKKWHEMKRFIYKSDPLAWLVWLPNVTGHPKEYLMQISQINSILEDIYNIYLPEETEFYVHDYLPGPNGHDKYPSIMIDNPTINNNLLNLNLTDL